ncbi:MAG: aminotransferase class I/II-fold pyridoxal phosphate-dependent enzyme [Oscillospiraceae bacterium]|nr:aminotransferase class I/II-fold pyridoxal phosphate-dependent enzyme [Oscillospiraceae bacterium]
MYELPKKLKNLSPYTPVSGEFKARLNANESFIGQDNEWLFSQLKNIDLNRYPDPYAKKTCEAFGEFYSVNPDFVTAGNGSDELISIIVSCFLEKGDKVLCFEPDFSMYFFYPKLYELDINILKKSDDFLIDIDGAIEYCNENKIKCILLSNPCNPTSVGFLGDEIKRLVKSVSALVIVDEAYMEFWDEKESLLLNVDEFENLIVLKTSSKALGLAAIRLGFAVAGKKVTSALKAAKSPYNVNVLTQEIGALVLQNRELNIQNINRIVESKIELKKQIESLNCDFIERIYDSKTNFLSIKVINAEEIYSALLDRETAISKFNDCLRITCGNETENNILVKALQDIIKETKS